jgi:hypothetical protein
MTDDLNGLRPRMMSVAYRMFGSVAVAEATVRQLVSRARRRLELDGERPFWASPRGRAAWQSGSLPPAGRRT